MTNDSSCWRFAQGLAPATNQHLLDILPGLLLQWLKHSFGFSCFILGVCIKWFCSKFAMSRILLRPILQPWRFRLRVDLEDHIQPLRITIIMSGIDSERDLTVFALRWDNATASRGWGREFGWDVIDLVIFGEWFDVALDMAVAVLLLWYSNECYLWGLCWSS